MIQFLHCYDLCLVIVISMSLFFHCDHIGIYYIYTEYIKESSYWGIILVIDAYIHSTYALTDVYSSDDAYRDTYTIDDALIDF